MAFSLDNIYLGDAYELIKQVPDKSIDLVYTDPPYEYVMGGKGKSNLGNRKYKSKGEIYSLDTNITKSHNNAVQPVSDSQISRFISNGVSIDMLDQLVRVSKKINIYLWCSRKQLRQLFDYFDDKNCYLDLLTWHKTNPIPCVNNTYLSDTEYCLFAREEGAGLYGSVLTKKKYYISAINQADKKLYNHPTIKPLEFVKSHIINSTKEGDVVFDPFLGSGTTAVAAKSLGRHFLGFELNKDYFAIAQDRINDISQVDRDLQNNGYISLF